MPTPCKPVLVQFPPGASHGLPLAVDRLDGLSRVLHSECAHSHGFFTMLYVHRGRGSVLYGRRTIPVSPGRLIVTAPGVMHDTRGMRGVDRWVVSFAPDALGTEGASWLFPRATQPEWAALLRRSSGVPEAIVVPVAERAQLLLQIRSIGRELGERGHGFREAARAYLKILLIRTSRFVTLRDAPEPTSPLLGEVFDVIESRFADRLSLSDVARSVGRSRAHLTTVVRQQTGMTVQQWIIERRMAEARQRLLASDENVGVVSERAGYGDATLFMRHFKRAHGVTPREWRRGAGPIER